MYDPLIKAFNYALDRLSKVSVGGLPKFKEERQIVFARSDTKCIGTETYLQGSYNPDIILIKWSKFKTECGYEPYSESYRSEICCKSWRNKPPLSWRNILSTVEVKRGDAGGAGSGGKAKARSVKSKYDAGFMDLRGDGVTESLKPPQSAPQEMVDEEYPMHRCMSIALLFPSHSHQVQSGHPLAREVKVLNLRLRIGRSHPKRGAENSTKPQGLSRRGPGAIESQNLVGPANRGRSQTNRRQKSWRDRKSKRRKFKVQSTQATRYHLPSTSPTQ